MKAVQGLLRDRHRAQRGSVLSGVLIMVAFLAIISGALVTELSTHFLISRTLVNRVSNEATVNSAMELALDQLQNTPLTQGCPSLRPAALPNGTAVASYVSCALVVDSGSTQFQRIAATSPFYFDGTHAVLPKLGRNDYLVGDAAGNVFDYRFDLRTLLWTRSLGGGVTGPPLETPDVNNPGQVSDLIPISSPNSGASPGCGPANFCVALIQDGSHHDHNLGCFMAASAKVTAQPSAGITNPDLAYFGDGNGKLFVYDATEGGNCSLKASRSIGGGAVVAGPVVFPGPGTDELYALVSDRASSQLVHYTYAKGSGLAFTSSLPLPAPRAVGMALERGTLPSRVAITFDGGQVALAQIQVGFGVSLLPLPSPNVPKGIARAPYWCQCPGGDLIGIGGRDGGLYLFDTSLNTNATYPPGGPAISTTPAADSAGDWFFGAVDGYVYEVARQAGRTTLQLEAQYGSGTAAINSSPILDTCNTTWVCVYAGSADAIYIVPLDARHSVFTACMSNSPPACSGGNPMLWASVQVGSASSLTTIHVRGWSYYSP